MVYPIISMHKITFRYEDKEYSTWVRRKHGPVSLPNYTIKFKSGKRVLYRHVHKRDKMHIANGAMLPAGLVTAIDIAIHEQIEMLLNQQQLLAYGCFINEEYRDMLDRPRA